MEYTNATIDIASYPLPADYGKWLSQIPPDEFTDAVKTTLDSALKNVAIDCTYDASISCMWRV